MLSNELLLICNDTKYVRLLLYLEQRRLLNYAFIREYLEKQVLRNSIFNLI